MKQYEKETAAFFHKPYTNLTAKRCLEYALAVVDHLYNRDGAAKERIIHRHWRTPTFKSTEAKPSSHDARILLNRLCREPEPSATAEWTKRAVYRYFEMEQCPHLLAHEEEVRYALEGETTIRQPFDLWLGRVKRFAREYVLRDVASNREGLNHRLYELVNGWQLTDEEINEWDRHDTHQIEDSLKHLVLSLEKREMEFLRLENEVKKKRSLPLEMDDRVHEKDDQRSEEAGGSAKQDKACD